MMNYVFHLGIMVNIYITICVSTSLLVGSLNLLSLGQAAFYGVGAYVAAVLLKSLNVPLALIFLISMGATALIGFMIAIPSLKLKGDYFILGTLAFQSITYTVLLNWTGLTQGPFGISGIPRPRLLGSLSVQGGGPYLLLSSSLMILTVLIFAKLVRSPFGRVLRAVREDEIAVLSVGRNVAVFKVLGFIISSSFIGLAGFLYAGYISYIDPGVFDLQESIFILAGVIIGGTGNIRGPVLGAIFVVLVPETFRFVGIPNSVAAQVRLILYGLCLISFMRWRPQGLLGTRRI